MPLVTPEAEHRFWVMVKRSDEESCWPWLGNVHPRKGYGRWKPTRYDKMYYVHRIAYNLTKGDIASDKQILHLCHNKLCCNPAHLRVGTDQENKLHESVSNKLQANSPSTVVGVTYLASHGVWRARGIVSQTETSLYWGPSFEEAVRARKAWEALISERLSTSLSFNI